MSNRNLNTQHYDPASVISAWSVVNPDSLLDRITPQLQKELLESALSELKDGLGIWAACTILPQLRRSTTASSAVLTAYSRSPKDQLRC